jgi:hypothetical protein
MSNNESCFLSDVPDEIVFATSDSAGKASNVMRSMFWLALLLALPCAVAHAQSQQTATGEISQHPLRNLNGNGDPNANADLSDPVDQQRQLRLVNAALHKSMVSDTEKLLRLVTELNAEISKTNPTSLTPEQLRKVAAIEKLAHRVRDDMRTSFEGTTPTKIVLPELKGPRP